MRQERFGNLLSNEEEHEMRNHPAGKFIGDHCPMASIHSYDDGVWEVRVNGPGSAKAESRRSAIDAVMIFARMVGWKDPSGERTGAPIGTVTKVTSRPCNCPGKGVEGGWHATWCAAKQVEIAIGAAPTAQVINDLERARRAFGDCAMVRDLEAKAHRCTCGTRDGKHQNTCGGLGAAVSAKVERAAPLSKVYAAVETAKERFAAEYLNAFQDLAPEADWEVRRIMGIDPAHGQDTTVTVVHHGSLEWLARELRLKPNADDETIKATTRLRLAGQFEELATAKNNNAILGAELLASNERVERALCEIAEERQENDTLRGMVAEVQLENRKLQRKGGA